MTHEEFAQQCIKNGRLVPLHNLEAEIDDVKDLTDINDNIKCKDILIICHPKTVQFIESVQYCRINEFFPEGMCYVCPKEDFLF